MDKFGINKKRDRADKKFGFGGKKGKFKKTDKKSMNDMSSFNPRGNFSGGMKSSKKGGGNAGAGAGKRPGKRARDSKRSRG
jgi:rRNA-processing protein EBP2